MAGHITEAELKRRMAKLGGFIKKPKEGGATIPTEKAKSKKPPVSKDGRSFVQKLRDRFQSKKLKEIERATGQSTEDLRRGFKLKP